MLPFNTFITIDKLVGTAVYQQIANSLVQAIRGGVLKPGTALPGTREMAKLLNVHRKTVIAAYNDLAAQDWIQVMPRKGVEVSRHLPELKPREWKTINGGTAYAAQVKQQDTKPSLNTPLPHLAINDGFPDLRLAPVDLLLREYRSLLKTHLSHKRLLSNDPAGSIVLRESLCRYLANTRGINAQKQNIMITQGAQMSIYLAINLLVKRGDHVIVAEPNYFLVDKLLEELGAKILRVPVDSNGVDMNRVESLCKQYKVKMMYVIPHHHHPTTVTLSIDRRMHLLELARQFDIMIVEDDYDYDYHYSSSPYLPLASTMHEGKVIYIGSFSKSLDPSIRIGFMVAPEGFIDQAAQHRRLLGISGDRFMEEALAVLINNDDISRHLKKVNKIYKERRDNLCNLLDLHLADYVQYQKPSGGMAVWARFNSDINLEAVSVMAAKKGLLINNGKNYNRIVNNNGLRLGFASLNEKEMEEAIAILVKCLK